MSIVDIMLKMPWWYLIILIIFSMYYSIRGVMEKVQDIKRQIKINNELKISKSEKYIIHYIQEFLFKFIFTMSSFIALFIANYIFSSLNSYKDINTGTAILLIFLVIWGISGISGYLTFLIISGKLPSVK